MTTREVATGWIVGLIIAAAIAFVALVEEVPGEMEEIPMSGERHYRGYA